MSATTSAASPRKRVPGPTDPAGRAGLAKAAVLAAIALDVAVLVVGCVALSAQVLEAGLDIVVWTAAAAVVGLAAIDSAGGPQLGMDMPILLAAGYLLGPIPAGIVAFAGYTDPREFRGEIALRRAVFNRAQTSLSVMGAATAFSLLGASVGVWPEAGLAALVAVGADCLINYGLVAGIMTLHEHVPPRTSLARLRVGSKSGFVSTYLCFGLLSVALAEVYAAVGAWGLLLFALPVVLARQALRNGQRLEGVQKRLRVQGAALEQASDQMAEERRDERLSIAAGLHDEVLPPIYRVHILGQVLRQELATGQLLAMEDDLPALIRATDEATDTLRGVIRSLRSSPLGTDGLVRALHLLLRELELESPLKFQAHIGEVTATPVIELLTYQIAREALRNAARHSRAASVTLALSREADSVRLAVEDDGQGFTPGSVDEEKHLGISLMRERVELAGGILQIDSSPGEGTRVVARLPAVDSMQM